MITSIVTAELAKLALNKLGELKSEDVLKALEALRKSGRGTALLVPGIGALGVGIAIGTGVGMLIAPRSGAETRAAVRDALRAKLEALRAKLGHAGSPVEDVEAREPKTGADPHTASN